MKSFRLGGVGLCALLICGCGGGNEREVAPVSGVVTIDGKPLDHGTVMFVPSVGQSAKGIINPDGSYVMTTYSNGDGAPVGENRVMVDAAIRGKGSKDDLLGMAIIESPIPREYADVGLSKLVFNVEADADNKYDIALSSKGPGG
jgi:hypothetical protein